MYVNVSERPGEDLLCVHKALRNPVTNYYSTYTYTCSARPALKQKAAPEKVSKLWVLNPGGFVRIMSSESKTVQHPAGPLHR